jgi:hypothetical protein
MELFLKDISGFIFNVYKKIGFDPKIRRHAPRPYSLDLFFR